MTILAFLFALVVLITVHEWGHYRVAVACGVKVLSFSIGLGPPLLRWRLPKPHAHQETEFFIRLIPLGGYVKMLDEREADVPIQDLPRAFNRQPVWARAAIVSAGPFANFIFAILLYAASLWIGQYETKPILAAPANDSVAHAAGMKSGDTVLRVGLSENELTGIGSMEQLRWWLLQHGDGPVWLEVQPMHSHGVQLLSLLSPEDYLGEKSDGWQSRGFSSVWRRALVNEVSRGGPAAMAGLQRGDEVLRINGSLVTDAWRLNQIIRESGRSNSPEPQQWEVLRADQSQALLEITPERAFDSGQWIGRVGINLNSPVSKVWIQYDFFDGLLRAWAKTIEAVSLTVNAVVRLVTGSASLDNLSGPLGMADHAGRSASMGGAVYVNFLAWLSVGLFVFNLLPLPMLDGGHLLYYLYEICTGHYPSPQYVDRLQLVGFILLIGLMFFALFNDVVRLGWLSQAIP